MLLSAKYEDGSKMDENQLVDEILILFAGHETTSNAPLPANCWPEILQHSQK
jgi:cytochrome P450